MADIVEKAVEHSEVDSKFIVVDEEEEMSGMIEITEGEEVPAGDNEEVPAGDNEEPVKDDMSNEDQEITMATDDNEIDVDVTGVKEIEGIVGTEFEDVEVLEVENMEGTKVEDKEIYEIGEEDTDPEVVNNAQIQKLVSQALESKLSGFQNQMQQMMAVIQNVSDVPIAMDDGQEDETRANLKEDVEGPKDSTPLKSPKPKKEVKPELSPSEIAEITKWESIVTKVCSILELEAVPVEEDARGRKRSSVQLPADDIILECWKNENANLKNRIFPAVSKLGRIKYLWPMSEQHAMGLHPELDRNVSGYLRGLLGTNKLLDSNMARIHTQLRIGDMYLRSQQKAISYASYFLRAVEKGMKGEQEVDKEIVGEMMETLKECLSDVCHMSVRASCHSLNARRRIYLDRMELNEGAYLDFMAMPSSSFMFGGELEPILKKHNLPLTGGKGPRNLPVGLDRANFRGRGRSGRRGRTSETARQQVGGRDRSAVRSDGSAQKQRGSGLQQAGIGPRRGGLQRGEGRPRQVGGGQKQGGGGPRQSGGGQKQGGGGPRQGGGGPRQSGGGPRQGGGRPRQGAGGPRQGGGGPSQGRSRPNQGGRSARQSGSPIRGRVLSQGGRVAKRDANVGSGRNRIVQTRDSERNSRQNKRMSDGGSRFSSTKRQKSSNQTNWDDIELSRQSLPIYDEFVPSNQGIGPLTGQSLQGYSSGVSSIGKGFSSNIGQDIGLDSGMNLSSQLGGRSQFLSGSLFGGGGSQLGSGLYNSGNADPYLGLMSFTDTQSSILPRSSGRYGNSSFDNTNDF